MSALDAVETMVALVASDTVKRRDPVMPNTAGLLLATIYRLDNIVGNVLALHGEWTWWSVGINGEPEIGKPLPPYCSACSSEAFAADVIRGWADLSHPGYVAWPCLTVQAVTAR